VTHFRVKYSKDSGYVYARFFSAPKENTLFESHGHLCFSPIEWENFRRCLQGNAGKLNTVTVIADRVPSTEFNEACADDNERVG
jgi:hypothetical protein